MNLGTRSEMRVTDFKDVISTFTAYKIVDATLGWKNNERQNTAAVDKLNEEELIRAYAFMAPSRIKSVNIELDRSIKKTMKAERYGGPGTGRNGGGVRCGIIDDVQIKGAGTNCLVGKRSPLSHSNGTLNIIDACQEAIFSEVLNKLLPWGTGGVLGILFTGSAGAVSFYEQGEDIQFMQGALLLREPVLRAAHFFPPEKFVPLARYEPDIDLGDERYTRLFDDLEGYLGKEKEFIRTIAQYAQRAAMQFSYANVAGITHGSLSVSNLGIDFKWIDLNCASTVDNFRNYSISSTYGVPSFSEEFKVPELIISKMIWEYGKCKNIVFDPTPVINYYRRIYDHYGAIYALNVLDFSEEEITGESLIELGGHLAKAVAPAGPKIYNNPSKSEIDLARATLIRSAYQAVIDGYRATSSRASTKIALSLKQKEIGKKFQSIWKELDATYNEDKAIYKCIRSLRKCYMASFFHRDRISIDLRLNSSRLQADNYVGKYIDLCLEVANWSLLGKNDTSKKVCILSFYSMEVYWVSGEGILFYQDSVLCDVDDLDSSLDSWVRELQGRLEFAVEFEYVRYLRVILADIKSLAVGG